jgi:hypothetical protein
MNEPHEPNPTVKAPSQSVGCRSGHPNRRTSYSRRNSLPRCLRNGGGRSENGAWFRRRALWGARGVARPSTRGATDPGGKPARMAVPQRVAWQCDPVGPETHQARPRCLRHQHLGHGLCFPSGLVFKGVGRKPIRMPSQSACPLLGGRAPPGAYFVRGWVTGWGRIVRPPIALADYGGLCPPGPKSLVWFWLRHGQPARTPAPAVPRTAHWRSTPRHPNLAPREPCLPSNRATGSRRKVTLSCNGYRMRCRERYLKTVLRRAPRGRLSALRAQMRRPAPPAPNLLPAWEPCRKRPPVGRAPSLRHRFLAKPPAERAAFVDQVSSDNYLSSLSDN